MKPQKRMAAEPPSRHFALREGIIEGLPSRMRVNTDLRHWQGRSTLPFHLRLALAFAPATPEGQPTPATKSTLEAFEIRLVQCLQAATPLAMVGHTTWRNGREFHFYLEDPGAAEAALDSLMQSHPALAVEAELLEDNDWLQVDFFFDYD